MQFWIIQTLNSIAFGGLLFLLSSGFSLAFGLMRIPNLAHGGFFGLEADHRDREAVAGRAPGRPEPSRHRRGDLITPPLDRRAQPVGVGDAALDNLNEHGILPCVSVRLSLFARPPWGDPVVETTCSEDRAGLRGQTIAP